MEIKITKIYDNLDPEEFKKDFEIKLEEIYLAENNPRYTIYVKNEEKKFDEFICEGFRKDNQKEVLLDILNSENNLNDLLKLLESIRNEGFHNRENPIYLFKNENVYITVEGNRRIMVIKLIMGLLELPSIQEIQIHNSSKLSEKFNVIGNNDRTLSRKTKTYDKIIKTLKEIKKNERKCEAYVKLANSDEMLGFVREKHLTGFAIGFRKWPRAKFFADLLKAFPNGLPCDNEENKNILKEEFHCDWKKIEDSYKNAMFVYLILFYGEFFDGNNDLKEPFQFDNEDVLKRMTEIQNVSSLEREHSYSQIKKIVCEEILKDNDETVFEQYFSIKFKKKKIENEHYLLIYFDEAKIRAEDFLKFIYRNWKNGVMTTRPVKDEDRQKFTAELEELFFGISTSHLLEPDELNDIDEWSIDIDNLQNLLLANTEHYKKNNKYDDFLIRFKYALDIRIQNKRIVKERDTILKNPTINSDAPIINFNNSPAFVFKSFLNQFEKVDDRYLNLKFSIISKFSDRLFLWMYYLIKSKTNAKDQYVKILSGTDQNNQDKVTEISHLLQECINEFSQGHVSRNDFDEMVKFYTNSKIGQPELDCFYKFIMERQTDKQWSQLNDFVPLPYKCCNHKNLLGTLNLFKKVSECAFEILSKIDFTKFSELNEKIIQELKSIDHSESTNDV